MEGEQKGVKESGIDTAYVGKGIEADTKALSGLSKEEVSLRSMASAAGDFAIESRLLGSNDVGDPAIPSVVFPAPPCPVLQTTQLLLTVTQSSLGASEVPSVSNLTESGDSIFKLPFRS